MCKIWRALELSKRTRGLYENNSDFDYQTVFARVSPNTSSWLVSRPYLGGRNCQTQISEGTVIVKSEILMSWRASYAQSVLDIPFYQMVRNSNTWTPMLIWLLISHCCLPLVLDLEVRICVYRRAPGCGLSRCALFKRRLMKSPDRRGDVEWPDQNPHRPMVRSQLLGSSTPSGSIFFATFLSVPGLLS
jgi:hypothetical protein